MKDTRGIYPREIEQINARKFAIDAALKLDLANKSSPTSSVFQLIDIAEIIENYIMKEDT